MPEPRSSTALRVQRLVPLQAAEYRALMLRAYASEADAFTSTVAEREALPLDWWAARIADDEWPQETVWGGFDGGRLVGLAGLMHERRERTSHKATLFGMYVAPEARRRGAARALVQAVLDRARATPGTQLVQLTVTDSNRAALALYLACGFVVFGSEPKAVRVGDRFVTKLHMWCPVDAVER